jgi:peptidoglycan/LPS O-acetylase OafA/YrhL
MELNTYKENKFYFPELDGLRFFAFLLVFIHHSSSISSYRLFYSLHKFGWIGVDLFFTLSAYLFTKLLLEEYNLNGRINILNFYIRRIFRIWPVYFIFVLSYSAIYYILKNNFSVQYKIRLTGLLTFSDNLFNVFQTKYHSINYLGHLWTISYEEQFYLIVPFIILILIKSPFSYKIVYLISAIISLNIIRYIMISFNMPHVAIWSFPLSHFEGILLGISIGFGLFNPISKHISPFKLGVIGIVFFVILCQMPEVTSSSKYLGLTYTLSGLSSSFVLFATMNSRLWRSFFSAKVSVFLGKRSYGLYLFHLFAIGATNSLVALNKVLFGNVFFEVGFSLLLTVAVSLLSYTFLEKPFLRLKKKYEIVQSRPI